jgi:hypothetical protein
VHVLDGSRMARRLLPQCIIDFGFALLIAVEYTFCTQFCIRHESPAVYTMAASSFSTSQLRFTVSASCQRRNIQNTTRYTALAPDRFKTFWRD